MRLNSALGHNKNQKTVNNWLERLPRGDLRGSGEQLIEIHGFICQNAVQPAQRLALQQQLFDHVCRWLHQLEIQFSENACNHPAVRLARMGSKVLQHLLEPLLQDLRSTLSSRPLLTWRRRALQQLTLALCVARRYASFALRCHVELNGSFWLATHYLYYNASQHNWLQHQLPDGQSILHGYHQLQLMGITDGKNLSPREIEAALLWTARLADKVALQPLPAADAARAGHLYLLDLTRGAPPQFLLESDALPQREHCLSCDLTAAIEVLKTHTSQAGMPGRDALSVIVAQRLMDGWQSPRRRRHQRQAVMQSMALIAQMRSIRQILGGGAVRPDMQARMRDRMPPSQISIFQAINKSESGLLLRGDPGYQSLKIGELLLIADKQAHRTPSLYAVRWTSVSEHANEVSCGAELIGNDPEAVDVSPLAAGQHACYQPALRLPAADGDHNADLLIIPGHSLLRGKEFRLRDQRGEHRVKVTRMHMNTGLYQAMEFQLAS